MLKKSVTRYILYYMEEKLQKAIFVALIVPAVMIFSGCSKKFANSMSRESISSDSFYSGSASMSAQNKTSSENLMDADNMGRKLIRTGHISVEVESLADTRDTVYSWVSALGGFVFSSSESATRLSITVRVPAQNFDMAMENAKGMCQIKSKDVSSEDVTEQFYDLESRLNTKKILLERYQSYLAKSSSVEDLLSIEERINGVTADIEAMQGQMNRLSSQIDFSTITVDAHLPPNMTESGFALPDTGGQFKKMFGKAAGFFNGLLFVVLYLLIFGVPIILLLALLWWLGFGKIGLIRKLFKKISVGKKVSPPPKNTEV